MELIHILGILLWTVIVGSTVGVVFLAIRARRRRKNCLWCKPVGRLLWTEVKGDQIEFVFSGDEDFLGIGDYDGSERGGYGYSRYIPPPEEVLEVQRRASEERGIQEVYDRLRRRGLLR